MPLIVTPPLPLPKPNLGLAWQEFHWYKISLDEHEAVIIDAMQSTTKIEREALEDCCKNIYSEYKKNNQRIKDCLNKL